MVPLPPACLLLAIRGIGSLVVWPRSPRVWCTPTMYSILAEPNDEPHDEPHEWEITSIPMIPPRSESNRLTFTRSVIERDRRCVHRAASLENLPNDEYTLATQGTDKVTAKITYVLLVKIVTDEPIKSPNFYRWHSKKAPKKHWTWHFFISFLLHSLYIWK